MEQAAPLIRKSVLIVEDDEHHQELLTFQLAKHGFTPVVVSRGEEALTLAENVRLDLIVLDVGLPGMDGWKTLERLRGKPECASIPVVMLTAASTPQNVVRGYSDGAQYFIPKPYSEDELVRGIRLLTS